MEPTLKQKLVHLVNETIGREFDRQRNLNQFLDGERQRIHRQLIPDDTYQPRADNEGAIVAAGNHFHIMTLSHYESLSPKAQSLVNDDTSMVRSPEIVRDGVHQIAPFPARAEEEYIHVLTQLPVDFEGRLIHNPVVEMHDDFENRAKTTDHVHE